MFFSGSEVTIPSSGQKKKIAEFSEKNLRASEDTQQAMLFSQMQNQMTFVLNINVSVQRKESNMLEILHFPFSVKKYGYHVICLLTWNQTVLSCSEGARLVPIAF